MTGEITCKHKNKYRRPVGIKISEKCDQVPHCPYATDELLEDCKSYFPPSATFKCNAPYIGNNVTIEILATVCNGVPECQDGIDEDNCPDTTKTTIIVLVICFIVFLSTSCVVIRMTKLQKPKDIPQLDSLSDQELIHLATVYQDTDFGKLVCKVLYQNYLKICQGRHAQTMNHLKVIYNLLFNHHLHFY